MSGTTDLWHLTGSVGCQLFQVLLLGHLCPLLVHLKPSSYVIIIIIPVVIIVPSWPPLSSCTPETIIMSHCHHRCHHHRSFLATSVLLYTWNHYHVSLSSSLSSSSFLLGHLCPPVHLKPLSCLIVIIVVIIIIQSWPPLSSSRIPETKSTWSELSQIFVVTCPFLLFLYTWHHNPSSSDSPSSIKSCHFQPLLAHLSTLCISSTGRCSCRCSWCCSLLVTDEDGKGTLKKTFNKW